MKTTITTTINECLKKSESVAGRNFEVLVEFGLVAFAPEMLYFTDYIKQKGIFNVIVGRVEISRNSL